MDWLSFSASIVGTLVWPAVVVSLVVLLRKPIKEVLVQLQSFRATGFGGSIGADFSERTERLQERVQEADLLSPESVRSGQTSDGGEEVSEPLPRITDVLAALTELAPRGAVIQAWAFLEQDLQRLGGETNTQLAFSSMVKIVSDLVAAGKLPEEKRGVITELRSLRNEILHHAEADITTEIARRYVNIIDNVRRTLEGA